MRLGIDPARFVPRLIFFLILCLPLWVVLVPAYHRVLATGLTVVLPLVGEESRSATVWRDFILIPFATPAQPEARPQVEGFRGYLMHYNVPLFAALILATPGFRIAPSLKALALGAPVLYALHLAYMILAMKLYPYTRAGASGLGGGWGYRWGAELYLTTVAQLAPILLWLLVLRSQRRKMTAANGRIPARRKAGKEAAA
jgi:hypothetical protein